MGVVQAQLLRFRVHLIYEMREIAAYGVCDGDGRVVAGNKEQTVEQVAHWCRFRPF